jgi:hypothetical protein
MFNLYLRTFCVITIEKAKSLNLRHVRNVHGDEINMINCRSVWEDDKGRTYRVQLLG